MECVSLEVFFFNAGSGPEIVLGTGAWSQQGNCIRDGNCIKDRSLESTFWTCFVFWWSDFTGDFCRRFR